MENSSRSGDIKLKEILIFAGTTEGRQLSEYLAAAEIRHTVCVATGYGEQILERHPLVKVHQGRMDREQIGEFLRRGEFAAVVDATHPFAKEITDNIRAALENMEQDRITVPYFRLKRDVSAEREKGITYFKTHEACAKALEKTKGNILLTTGSRNLSAYCAAEEVKRRLYVRVLPGMESLSLCMEQGICGKQIIAMQGPFTTEMNEATIRQYGITCLVTKESGAFGGYQEKIEAAKRTGAEIFVIGTPGEDEGDSFSKLCQKLEAISGRTLGAQRKGKIKIILAGIGMGHADSRTKEVERAVGEADLILGAERMLRAVHSKAEKRPFYQAKQIIPYLEEIQQENTFIKNKKVVVLFSGDSGFYSGCSSLYAALKKEIAEERLRADVHILPGISAVAYLAACIGESWQDAEVCSIHGKELCNLARRIKGSPKTFLLTSGVGDINRLGELLGGAGLSKCEIITGYGLSYEEQRIERHTPAECMELKEEGLYTCFVRNPYAVPKSLTHGIADGAFIRDGVPMTKEEIREVSICKLRLKEGAVVYDIGGGTGSVAVEIAGLSDDVCVYALERNPEAALLIEKNKKKFDVQNVNVVGEEAPEGFAGLPAATHAFIGGSGGRLKEILSALRRINPGMRVVLNAVSLETVCEIREILSEQRIKEEEVVQLQISRAKKAGGHHLMQSGNPVWICAFNFDGTDPGREA
ncbi:MAG: precorrin-6A reductase [Muribaculaceae bacterium]|nr:precorrin-6A reductase [Roseburia sp.]MCM1431954.1 precorrin-6A reductase [Muribaculaceae bacterium]MCM1493584.1 precorrin-6A reductase [Muribaculaceae bacterium]